MRKLVGCIMLFGIKDKNQTKKRKNMQKKKKKSLTFPPDITKRNNWVTPTTGLFFHIIKNEARLD